jgi:hypothetical protein
MSLAEWLSSTLNCVAAYCMTPNLALAFSSVLKATVGELLNDAPHEFLKRYVVIQPTI